MSAIPLEADPLIAEAKERARRRRLLALAAVVAATAAIATPLATRSSDHRLGGAASSTCGITALGTRILQNGRTVYQEPGPDAGPPAQVQCSGSSVWAVWNNGGSMMQTAYFGVHSSDAGRTWRPVFAERYFGRKAPHQLDANWGPWTVRGSAAYFVGYCEACSVGGMSQTVSLYVTKDGGKTFRTYPIPALTGYLPVRIAVAGSSVTVVGDHFAPGTKPRESATVWVA